MNDDVMAASPFDALSRQNLSESAYRQIRNALAQSRLKSGQKLVLRSLAEQLGISATPVREALLRLGSEGIVRFDSRGTAFVPEMTLQRYLEIRDLRLWLEGQAGLRAVDTVNAADIERLAAIHERMAAAEKNQDSALALEMNGQFHLHLCMLAQMPMLLQFVENLWVQCGPAMGVLYEVSPPRDPEGHQHLAVLRGLAQRDGEAVRKAIERDIVVGGQRLVSLLSQSKA
ncbi:DNA-binding GntR family transcriptional regulator [Kaistia hirudinis]|uniref:DNA-binding GntR family transcriptional regulator n=1 Tax=Kaistia hirudinis TaxID=1293440 RepID=A0A840AQT4_9HYPH|nr:GntR family transcriptional regulator [Kaistia hirudinis]MBB3931794.1 DNA-binding GntR family transcriptional regulator [Kaistia hirudinis]